MYEFLRINMNLKTKKETFFKVSLFIRISTGY